MLLYVDPGSGSYLVQMLIAAILGALFYFKNLWLHIKLFFSNLFRNKGKDQIKNDKLDV
ncbi:MAG: hypothetical protein H7Y27_04280 [Gemmatimonadaceae bacterium]|nr:hypothetical protein [Chitinophagaceae bacterium]